jgi:hypothetical protein
MKSARRPLLQRDSLPGLLAAALAFPVYLLTLSNTVTAEDCGELAAALHGLGIVHPTGYPIFSWLGWVFGHLPIAGRVIWKLNLFGAVLCTVATFLFYRLFLFLLSEKAAALFRLCKPTGNEAKDPDDSGSRRVAAAVAALVFAFSRTYWSEATAVEVYALHLVFLALDTWLFLRALSAFADKAPAAAKAAQRAWILFAFVLGLSFSNHMMTVLLAPAFLVLYFQVLGLGKAAWSRIGLAVIPFVAGLTPYLFLLLRARQAPRMNWGDPSTFAALKYHVTAGQYHGQMFSSLEIALRKLAQFTVDFPREFGYVPLLLAALGAWGLIQHGRRLSAFIVLLFFGCLFYSVNYAFDDPNFYLNAYLAVAMATAFGVLAILRHAPARLKAIARFGCAALIVFPLTLNYRSQDKSADRAVEDYALNVLGSMDHGAVFFTNEYQRMAAPAFYLQIVEKVRPDIAVIDIVMLANPWYIPHLKAMHPWLYRNSQQEFDAYRPELDRFIRGKADTVAYHARVKDLFLSIVRNSGNSHPVYVSSGINVDAAEGYRLVPSGMVFRLAPIGDRVPVAPRNFRFSPLPSPQYNVEVEAIRNEYAEGYANQGAWLVEGGDTVQGVALLRKALSIHPEFPAVFELLSRYERR